MRERDRSLFLEANGLAGASRMPLAGDASARRYERVTDGDRSRILMDAPPPEDVGRFVAVARELATRGYSPPEIYAEDLEKGFLLLEDLGDGLFSDLMASGEPEEPLYRLAVNLLIDFSRQAPPSSLPHFSDDYLRDQNRMFLDWYVPAKTGVHLSDEAERFYQEIWEELLPDIRVGPEVMLLRDFHSDNLLYLKDREGLRSLGLLDFQDALRGPAAYDLVSLLQDARRDVHADTDDMIHYYLEKTGLDETDFLTSYAILGAHRALRIMGIFTRLAEQDGKTAYLELMPRMRAHLARNLTHPALAALKNWLAVSVGEGNS